MNRDRAVADVLQLRYQVPVSGIILMYSYSLLMLRVCVYVESREKRAMDRKLGNRYLGDLDRIIIIR